MPPNCGLFETATGDLISAGRVDFTTEGDQYGSSIHFVRSDCPLGAKTRGDTDYSEMTRWDGSKYVEVAQP